MLYNFNGTLLNVADIVTVSTSKGQRVEKYIKKVRADLQPLKKFAKESAENG